MAKRIYITKHPVPECTDILDLVLKETNHSISSKIIAEKWYSLKHPDYKRTPDTLEEISYISKHIGGKLFSPLKHKGIMSKVGKSYAVDLEACQKFYNELVASKQGESTATS